MSAVRGFACVIVVGAAVAGCGTSDDGPADGAVLPLDECVVGTWVGRPSICGCLDVQEQPECDQADCERVRVRILQGDMTAFQFSVFRSESAGTFSTVFNCPLPQSWAVTDDGRILISRDLTDNPGVAVQCDAERLDVGTASHFFRADDAFARAMEAVPGRTSCVGVPY